MEDFLIGDNTSLGFKQRFYCELDNIFWGNMVVFCTVGLGINSVCSSINFR
jgi:hypothetical protein